MVVAMPEKKQAPFRPELLPADLQGQMEPDYERLVDAIFPSEGGEKTQHPYGIKSVKVSGKEEARRVALNTVRNNFKRWQDAGGKWKDGKPVTYFEFLARRFVPPEADPKGHTNWLINVPSIYNKLGKQVPAPAAAPAAPLPAYDPALRSYSVE